MTSLKKKTFENVAYIGVARIVALVFQSIANIILSRALTSSDYGLVGFATIFVNFFSQFSDLGLNSAVVHRKQLDDTALHTGFTMKLGIGLFLYIIAFCASGLAVFFFDNPGVVGVIKLLALNFIINSFSFIPTTMLKRELDYKKIASATVCQTMVNSSLAMILALAGFKYWSIVIANICATLAMILTLNYLKPVKIKFAFDRESARQFMSYGTSLSLTGFIVFTIFNVDNFIIGAVKGSTELGYYMIAFNWGSIICVILGTVVNSVLFPTFSRMEQDRGRIKRSYFRVLEYVSFVGILANVTLLLISRDFLVHVLGHGTDKWLPALQSLRILCAYGIVRFLLEPLGNVLMALDMNKVLLKTTALSAIIEVVLIYPMLKFYGIEGVSLLITATYLVQYGIYYPIVKKTTDIQFSEFVSATKDAFLSASVIIALSLFLRDYFSAESVMGVVAKVIVIAFIYFVLHGLLNKWKLVREAREMLLGVR
ncbi:polysaccharide biosynthesis protein [Geobacter metallireducens RCH3]|uniref:Undecaprenyl-diphospho-oligosaccharide flippase n=1 Tax=Geobacter metallireducens (strain ATCC 53774 / DSM 7210 / GS-15) TaxID=269799 RepID=Q39U33_GEOMG|nr:lipopolysaccharide biosynthesis protein [Geobacter metallireducens]ABB32241.1 undecaprenyl-diphospho-oligosaccharide flippase [Geobacter metallireducens GS-15]EHP86991.1 polysaccharide biosynthesis protein [Geobacter metallireducens RCH3]